MRGLFLSGIAPNYEYYEFGRTVSEKNRLGKTQEFFYDAESRLKSKVDFNGNEIKIQYSDGGRTEKHIFTDGTESIIKYNMSGNVIYAKNEHSQYFYEYDKGGKLISVLDVIGGDKISYTYDRAGNRLSMKSNSSNIEYSYGKNGELKSINDKNQLTSVKFFYDKSGREIKRVFGNGNEKLTSYDKAGRAVLIIERNSRGVLLWGEGYVYDSLGRIAAKVTGDGAVTLYEYDEQGRLEKAYYPLMKELQGKQSDEALENGIYSEAVHPGENKYLSHDITNSLNSLLFKMGGSASSVLPMQAFNVEEYTYDNNSNLVAKTTCYGKIEYKYDAENRLVSSGANGMAQSVTYKYDANGNLLLKTTPFGKSEYRYNAKDRMSYSEVIDEKTKTFAQNTYSYDAFGRRIASSDVSGVAVRTLYDGFSFDVVKKSPMNLNGQFADYGEGAVKTESSESQEYRYYYGADTSKNEGRSRAASGADFEIISDAEQTVRSFISLGGVPIVESDVSGGANYYGTDIRGSVRSMSGFYGDAIGTYEYDVFGNILGDVDVGYGYCGKSRSLATGLYDYGFRDYDAGVGRFTTMDPIRDGVNWFGYCGGDAVNWVDLWGLKTNPVISLYTMQNKIWANEKLVGEDSYIKDKGCAVTLLANIDCANGGRNTPSTINEKYVKNGNVDWSLYAKDNDMSYNRVTTALTKDTYNAMVADSNTHNVGVLVDCGYGGHWVGVQYMVSINGNDYYVVSGTSNNDINFYGTGNKRNESKWVQKTASSVLVPVEDCLGYVDFIKKNK